jgi:hypothetical protein
MSFDRVSSKIRASLRCHVQEELPDGGLLLRGGSHEALTCSDSGLPGWSSALADANGEDFDAATLDWSQGLVLHDATLGWRFRLAAKRVRIFVDGRPEGLPGLVEVGQTPRGQQVYFAYNGVHSSRLTEWGQVECLGFTVHPILAGFPEGWEFASCNEVMSDQRVRSAFPELALSERVHVALVGGIRRSRGREYFAFALPSLLLEGGNGHEAVSCNGTHLAPQPGTQLYPIPGGLAQESRITIEVARGGEPVRRLSIYLTGNFEWRQSVPEQLSNELGGASASGMGAAGGLVVGSHPELNGFERDLLLTPGLHMNAPCVYLIGRLPGQIRRWPPETPATDWRPIWAVPMWRRGRAVYCGTDLDRSGPIPNLPDGDRRSVQEWKDILWHQRKRISPPEFPALATLWRSYVEAARVA